MCVPGVFVQGRCDARDWSASMAHNSGDLSLMQQTLSENTPRSTPQVRADAIVATAA